MRVLARLRRQAVPILRGRPGRLAGWAMLSTAALAGTALYAWALWKAPDLMHLRSAQDRYNARILVISVGGAVVVGVGLLYTARTYRLSHRGQITDRFTNALEQLNAEELYVRVGGVQALSRLIHDSPVHHDDVVEVLAAFVSDRVPAGAHPPALSRQSLAAPNTPPADVQAALTALAYRPRRPERRAVALAGTCLTGQTSAAQGWRAPS
jgi:hypothetical protein